jgi:hypothetical protein
VGKGGDVSFHGSVTCKGISAVTSVNDVTFTYAKYQGKQTFVFFLS